jgi:hypothetical protein
MPLLYSNGRWISTGGGGGGGTKLTSAAKWGKTFPWEDCVERLRTVCGMLEGAQTIVYDDGIKLLADAGDDDVIYADPPYVGTSGYTGSIVRDYLSAIQESSARIILSEKSDFSDNLDGDWTMIDGEVVARVSGGVGANGKRRELIYVRDPSSTRRMVFA